MTQGERVKEIRKINFNMGCIETNAECASCVTKRLINFNMGCIEIQVAQYTQIGFH